MKKETFIRFLELSIENGKKEKVIHDNGLDLINFMNNYYKVNNILLSSIYDESLAEIINDFILDNVYDELEKNKSYYLVYDSDENIVADCSTIDGLYDFVESERLRLISEGFSYQMKPDIPLEDRLKAIEQLFKK